MKNDLTFAAYIPVYPQPVLRTHTEAPKTVEPGHTPVGGPSDLVVMAVCTVALVLVCLGSRG